MIRKTVEFATPGTRLSVSHHQLVVDRPNVPRVTLPIEDLGVVIVDDIQATYTQAVFHEILDAGATLLVTGRDHLPAGMMLPLDAHHVQTERHRAQIQTSKPLRKRTWQAIIRAKIGQQAAVLSHFTGDHGGLLHMSRRVRSGDPDNLEAQAAQRYWPRLFGTEFRRDRTAEGINALLNYGYAVVRAAVARAIVAAGLIPSLGVHHRHRGNPFCLADDLLEAYRPYVDWRVRHLTHDGEMPRLSLSERKTRAALLSLLSETVHIAGRREPLLLAVHSSAGSLCRALTGGDRKLCLPEGVPAEFDPVNGAGPE